MEKEKVEGAGIFRYVNVFVIYGYLTNYPPISNLINIYYLIVFVSQEFGYSLGLSDRGNQGVVGWGCRYLRA